MVQQQQQQQQQQIFVSVLQNNLEHLNDFFIDKEEDAIMRLQSLKDSLTLASVSHAEGRPSLDRHASAAPGSPPHHHHHQHGGVDGGHTSYVVSVQAKEALVQLHGDLVQVLHWALLNNAAVLKILKKHDKLTGLHLRGGSADLAGRAGAVSALSHIPLSTHPPFTPRILLSAGVAHGVALDPMSSLEVVESLVKEVEQLVGNCTTARPATQQRHPSRPANASSTDVLGPASMPRTPQHASTSDATTTTTTTTTRTTAAESAAIPEGVPEQPPVAGPPHGGRFAAGGRAHAGPAMAALAAGNAMLEMTRAALAVWQKMGTNASTPSTVAPFPAPTSVLSVLAQLQQVAPQQQHQQQQQQPQQQQGVTRQGVAPHADALPGTGAPPQQQQQQVQQVHGHAVCAAGGFQQQQQQPQQVQAVRVSVSTVALHQGPDMSAVTVQQHGADGQPGAAALGGCSYNNQPSVGRKRRAGDP
ncbi:MAG: hypothetical protein WDW36_003251 [Sanguina aurantia]